MRYLKTKGKLNETFQSNASTLALSECTTVVEKYVQLMKTLTALFDIRTQFSNKERCLTDEFDNTEACDYTLAIAVIRRSTVKDAQLMEDTKNRFKNMC